VKLERRRRLRRADPDAMWHTQEFIMVEGKGVPRQAVLL
jgi:hypothetical protein